jgi:hypothetical protein
MDLYDAHRAGMALAIKTELGGERLMAEVWPRKEGLVFADIGWPGSPAHAFHTVIGVVVTEANLQKCEAWRINRQPIRVVERSEPLFEEWRSWALWKSTHPEAWEECAHTYAESDERFAPLQEEEEAPLWNRQAVAALREQIRRLKRIAADTEKSAGRAMRRAQRYAPAARPNGRLLTRPEIEALRKDKGSVQLAIHVLMAETQLENVLERLNR